jgi:hypothetical protein
MKYFLQLWAISALAALLAVFLVLAVWLLVHVGVDETATLTLSYITSFRLIIMAVGASVLIGLTEATVITGWQSRKSKRTRPLRSTASERQHR